MRLADLQRTFQDFILEASPGIEHAVLGTPRVPIDTRLSIYSGAYGARLTEALDSNFPILAQLLGERQFKALAEAYLARHHSAHFSIRWYGEQLASFLAEHPPYDSQPLLTELAHWEWNMTLAFDAADAPVLRRSALAVVGPEEWSDLSFKLHPSVRMLTLRTEAPAVWRALSREEAPPEGALTANRGAEKHWAIWRRGLDTFFRSMEPAETDGLRALARGDSFGRLCEMLARAVGDEAAARQAAGLLARWLEDEMLAG